MGKIIVEEAGGGLTDFQGNPLHVQLNTERNTNIIAGNQELTKKLLEYVSWTSSDHPPLGRIHIS